MTQLSMVNVAYDVMKQEQKEMNFHALYEKVSAVMGFDETQYDDKMSLFYTNITMDGRFITLGENVWDLRERHKFDQVHIDMNDIYADYTEEEEDDGVTVDAIVGEEVGEEDDEEDDGASQEDSYDDD